MRILPFKATEDKSLVEGKRTFWKEVQQQHAFGNIPNVFGKASWGFYQLRSGMVLG